MARRKQAKPNKYSRAKPTKIQVTTESAEVSSTSTGALTATSTTTSDPVTTDSATVSSTSPGALTAMSVPSRDPLSLLPQLDTAEVAGAADSSQDEESHTGPAKVVQSGSGHSLNSILHMEDNKVTHTAVTLNCQRCQNFQDRGFLPKHPPFLLHTVDPSQCQPKLCKGPVGKLSWTGLDYILAFESQEMQWVLQCLHHLDHRRPPVTGYTPWNGIERQKGWECYDRVKGQSRTLHVFARCEPGKFVNAMSIIYCN